MVTGQREAHPRLLGITSEAARRPCGPILNGDRRRKIALDAHFGREGDGLICLAKVTKPIAPSATLRTTLHERFESTNMTLKAALDLDRDAGPGFAGPAASVLTRAFACSAMSKQRSAFPFRSLIADDG